MRRLLATATLAAAALGVVPSAPASASYTCTPRVNGDQYIGVCAGSWCPDLCFLVAWVECDGYSHRICDVVDDTGFPPGFGR